MIEFIEAPELCGAVIDALNAISANAGTEEPTALQQVSESDIYPGTGPLTRDQLDLETQVLLHTVLESPNADLIRPYSAIAALYRGEWTDGFQSQSEADAAFCGHLAAQGLNPLQIDMALRTSSLYRGKWERADYRQRTLGLTISRKAETLSEARTPPPGPNDWLAPMNERYAVVRIGSDAAVMDFKTPSTGLAGVLYKAGILKFTAFRQLLAGEFIPGSEQDKPVKKADAWLSHSGRRQYQSMAYAPGEILAENVLNLWRGFQVEAKAGCVKLWLDVLNRLVTDSQLARWVLMWLAWRIQNPGDIPGTMLIFKGRKGTGKNSLFDPVVILFGEHSMVVDDPESIIGRFNGHLLDKAFVVLDEAMFAGDLRQADKLKARITASSTTYEFKGMTPIPGVNRCAYVMLTNHDHVWQASLDERRAVVIEVGDSLIGDHVFWGRYHAWVKSGGPAALLHFLQSINVTGFNPRAIPIGTKLESQIELTVLREPAAAWWHQCLSDGEVRWLEAGRETRIQLDASSPTHIDGMGFRFAYEQSSQGRGRHAPVWSVVSKKVRRWCAPHVIGDLKKTSPHGMRIRELILPPLPDMQQAFTDHTGVTFI